MAAPLITTKSHTGSSEACWTVLSDIGGRSSLDASCRGPSNAAMSTRPRDTKSGCTRARRRLSASALPTPQDAPHVDEAERFAGAVDHAHDPELDDDVSHRSA